MKYVINLDDAHLEHHVHGGRFEARYGALGAGLHAVPPRKRAWPFTSIISTKALFLTLEGASALRSGRADGHTRSSMR